MSADPPLNSPNSPSDPTSLTHLTRVVLIASIIIVTGFIGYNLLRPEEEFVQFSLLNDELIMGNYPTSVPVGVNLSFYLQIEKLS